MFTHVLRKAKQTYYQNALKDCGPRETWRLLDDITKGNRIKKESPPSFKIGDDVKNDPKRIAESFNSYFASVGNDLKEWIPPFMYHRPY